VRPADCHDCEYAPLPVFVHSVMVTLVDPYDVVNAIVT
jgi:hypothetical protein